MASDYSPERQLAAKLANGALSIITPFGSLGSGVRVNKVVLTAAHVVLPGELTNWDPASVRYDVGCCSHRTPCSLLGYHLDYDVAVLAPLEPDRIEALPRFTISSDAHIGDPIWVGGYPFGIDIPVVRRGSIASVVMPNEAMIIDRNLFVSERALFPSYWIDVPIFPGNSGGPVLNANGDLIGIALQTLSMPMRIPSPGAGGPNTEEMIPIYMDIGIALRIDALQRTGLDKFLNN